MTEIQDELVVKMNYTLTNDQGEVLDSSEGAGPLEYIQGKQNIIPGLEREMAGKKIGDKFKVNVHAKDAYGEHSPEMIQSVPKEQFGAQAGEVQVGMQFQLQAPTGQTIIATAIEIKETEIVLDANHPLAGQNLTFDIEVLALREATQEELAHGHVHSGGDEKSCSDDTCCD